MFDFSQLLGKTKANPIDNMLADQDQRLTLARKQYRGWIIFIEAERRRLVHILEVIGDTFSAPIPTPTDPPGLEGMPASDGAVDQPVSETNTEIPEWDPVPTPQLPEPTGDTFFSPFDLPVQEDAPTPETAHPVTLTEPDIRPDDTRPGLPTPVDEHLNLASREELDQDYTPPEEGMLAAFQAANRSHDIPADGSEEMAAASFPAVDGPDRHIG